MSLGKELDSYLEGLHRVEPPGSERLVAEAMRRLHERPDAPLAERVQWGVVVCTNGNPEADTTFGQVAEVVGCSINDVHQALMHQREVAE